MNDEFRAWREQTYAADNIGEVKSTRGYRHDYLAMVLDFSEKGSVKIDMTKYMKQLVEDFPDKLNDYAPGAWTQGLFDVDPKSPKASPEKANIFHQFTMKIMFAAKRGRQDLLTGVSFLSTRTKVTTVQDYEKLRKMMSFIKATWMDVAKITLDDSNTMKWYVDASFACHPDMRSHTGAVLIMGKGAISSDSKKQKVNSKSTTESELIGLDDVISKILWGKLFMEAQGYKVKVIVYRDNESTMKLEQNGQESLGKRTRHFNIKYFYATDLIQRGELSIEYCNTDDMIADYMTKATVGQKFKGFREDIMNLNG